MQYCSGILAYVATLQLQHRSGQLAGAATYQGTLCNGNLP